MNGMSKGSIPIVFDIGGTSMRVAAIRDGALDDIEIVDTPSEPEEGLKALIALAQKIAGTDGISELVGDISGVVQNGAVFRSPNLPQWNNTDIVGELTHDLKKPVTLFNDAELVALGEYWHGAGFHSKTMAYITVSTGVGSALIVDGKIDKDGRYNYELGHQLVRGKDHESQISGIAVKKKYGREQKDFTNNVKLKEMEKIIEEEWLIAGMGW